MSAIDIQELDRRAVRGSVAIVASVSAGDLGRATPCEQWSLGDLLAHMTVQHDGFAAASVGQWTDVAQWAVRPPGDDPVAGYTAAAERVIAAFAEPGVLERKFELPEIIPGLRFPAAQAMSFHFVDYVVHGWDVARSLGIGYEVDNDLAEAALAVAKVVPNGPERLQPGAAFRPGRTTPADAPVLDQVLTMLGRSPDWRP